MSLSVAVAHPQVTSRYTGVAYVPTMSTGSGKSPTYIIPIVYWVLRVKAAGTYALDIEAIMVYSLNALANGQLGELEKLLELGIPDAPPVTFDRLQPWVMEVTVGTMTRATNTSRQPDEKAQHPTPKLVYMFDFQVDHFFGVGNGRRPDNSA